MNITKATSAETDQNPSFEENNSTNSNQIEDIERDDLAYYSPDDDYSDSEESKAITIKLSIRTFPSRKCTKKSTNFLTPNTCSTSRRKGSTPEKFVAWWNENHQDFQITVDSIKKWTYREDEDHSRYNIHWSEYGD
ncbi:9862_t:CDS:2 [Ambispora leptoticha]|uniref:9862_t:CDS:1 n=1 Tax=Ambispora leptoticha TaxID=144679 RepID=A0A9N9EFK8_9GLOM|nr:9862_t:CDS:2 [Ambispora leptoticha]